MNDSFQVGGFETCFRKVSACPKAVCTCRCAFVGQILSLGSFSKNELARMCHHVGYFNPLLHRLFLDHDIIFLFLDNIKKSRKK